MELSIANAKDWYKVNSTNWSRFNSLLEALNSYDEKSQVKALFYLRNGKSSCEGLNKDTFLNKVKESIQKLSNSDIKRISENAKLILLDEKFEFLKIKGIE